MASRRRGLLTDGTHSSPDPRPRWSGSRCLLLPHGKLPADRPTGLAPPFLGAWGPAAWWSQHMGSSHGAARLVLSAGKRRQGNEL
jgi:hypothetical protein